MLHNGIQQLRRSVDEELELWRGLTTRLKKLTARLTKLAEDPDAFPLELEYEYPGRGEGDEYPLKSETLSLETREDALKAAQKLERSLPRWDKLRREALDGLRRRRDTIDAMGDDLAEVVSGWQGLMRDVVQIAD